MTTQLSTAQTSPVPQLRQLKGLAFRFTLIEGGHNRSTPAVSICITPKGDYQNQWFRKSLEEPFDGSAFIAKRACAPLLPSLTTVKARAIRAEQTGPKGSGPRLKMNADRTGMMVPKSVCTSL
jgi:hypothetical protein